MSGFDDIFAGSLIRGSNSAGRIDRTKYEAPGQSWLDTAFQVAGTFEDVQARLLGKLSGVKNPKFEANFGSNFQEQVTFADLFREWGMPSYIAAGAGIAAAITNPFDALNKFNVGKLTKAGYLGETLGRTGKDALKLAGKTAKGLDRYQFDESLIKKRVSELEKAVVSKGDKATVRQSKAALQAAKLKLGNVRDLNRLLDEAQNAGKSIDDLMLQTSLANQFATGQRSLVGFEKINSLSHLPGFGRGDLIDNRTVSRDLSGGVAKLMDNVSRNRAGGIASGHLLAKTAGAGAEQFKHVKDKLAEKWGLWMTSSQRAAYDEIATEVRKVMGQGEYNAQKIAGLLENLVQKHGLNEKQLDEILEALDTGSVAETQLLRKVASQLDPSGFKIGNQIKLTDDVDEFNALNKRSKVNDDQRLLLTPSGIDPRNINRIVDDVTKAGKWTKLRGTQGEIALTPDHVVIHQTKGVADGELEALNKVTGAQTYMKVPSAEGDHLVARKLPRGRVPDRDFPITSNHLENLQLLMAGLARQNKAITHLNSRDLLINDFGGIQLINPDRIKTLSSKSEAVRMNRDALRAFSHSDTVLGVIEPEFLASVKAAQRAPKYLLPRSISGIEKGAQHFGTDDLLMEAVNAGLERDFLRAAKDSELLANVGEHNFAKYNGVLEALQVMEAQRKAGKGVKIKPIKISSNAAGELVVTEGLDRLLAAKLLGAATVPVHHRSGLKETIDASRGIYTRARSTLASAFDADEARSTARLGQDTGQGKPIETVSKDYKLFGEGASISDGNLRRAGQTQALVLARFTDLLGSGQSSARPATVARDVKNALLQSYGSEAAAAVELSDVLIQTDKAGFLEHVQNVTGLDLRYMERLNPRIVDGAYADLQGRATEHLLNLARNNILTNSTVKIPEFRQVMLRGKQMRGMFIDRLNNTVDFQGGSTELLRETAEAFVRKNGGADGIDPFANVRTISDDGEVIERQVREISPPDDVQTIAQTISKEATLDIPDAEKALLAEKGIFVNPTPEQLGIRNGAVVASDGSHSVPFLVTRSGDVVASARHHNVADLAKDVFGEGPIYGNETGFIIPGRVYLDDLSFDGIDVFNRQSAAQLTSRLKVVAKSIQDMGFSDGHVLDITTRLDPEMWGRIYPDGLTVGEVLKKRWKLKVPEDLSGLPVNVADEIGASRIGLKTPKFSSDSVERAVRELREQLIENWEAEVARGLPVQYREPYFPRLQTPEAQKAFTQAMQKIMKKDKSFSRLESFMKSRLWGDVTTKQVNTFFKGLNKIRKGDPQKSADDLMKDAYQLLSDEMGKSLDDVPVEKMRSYLEIANEMPSGSNFFHENAFTAIAERTAKSAQAQKSATVVDGLRNWYQTWEGTVDELRAFEANRTELRTLKDSVTEKTLRIDGLKEEIAQLGKDIDPSALQRRIDDLTKSATRDQRKFDNLSTSMSKTKGNAGLDGKVAYIDGDQLDDLIRKGLVNADTFPDAAGQGLVRITDGELLNAVTKDGTKLMAFDPAAAPIIDRFFRSQSREGFNSFLNHYDNVLSAWRTMTLVVIPSYFVRNGISDAFLGWLGGITRKESYEVPMRIMKVMRRYNTGELTLEQAYKGLDEIVLITSDGTKQITGREMYNEFFQRGGITGGLFQNEFARSGEVKRLSQTQHILKQNGLEYGSTITSGVFADNRFVRTGIWANSSREMYFRMAAFFQTWVDTGDYAAGAMKMKEIFYDYSDLTAFERDVMRRVMPFYTWSRRNIPAQVRGLVARPEVHLKWARMFHELESGLLGDNEPGSMDIPGWARRNGLTIGQTKDGRYITKLIDQIIPVHDLYKLFAGEGFGKMFMDGLTPFAKIPIEQLSNTSLFTGAPLEDFEGQASDEAFGFLGFTERSQSPFQFNSRLGPLNAILSESFVRSAFRPAAVISDLIDNFIADDRQVGGTGAQVGMALGELALGKFLLHDPERTMASMRYDRQRLMSSYRRAIRKFENVGNSYYANESRKRLALVEFLSSTAKAEEKRNARTR